MVDEKPGLYSMGFFEFLIMNEIQRAKIVYRILNQTYPKITVPLKSRNVFTLLVSVLLSAQCTDVNVNTLQKIFTPNITNQNILLN